MVVIVGILIVIAILISWAVSFISLEKYLHVWHTCCFTWKYNVILTQNTYIFYLCFYILFNSKVFQNLPPPPSKYNHWCILSRILFAMQLLFSLLKKIQKCFLVNILNSSFISIIWHYNWSMTNINAFRYVG